MKAFHIFRLTILLFTLCYTTSCKKFVEIPPNPTQILHDKIFEDDGTATKAITGIYIQMMGNNNSFSSGNTTYYAGMCADELTFYLNDGKQEFLKNEISFNNHGLISTVFWSPAYKHIYTANACIEGLEKSQTLTPTVKRSLTGEAKFIRAYCYFYLVNLFGDVPLVTTTNFELNALLPRAGKASVYKQIIDDLNDAQTLLEPAYVSSERVRPNKWTAAALLARAYLYTGDWEKVINASSAVIGSGTYSLQPALNTVFLKGSNETIFQIPAGSSNINSWEGNVMLPASNGSTPTYLLTPSLLNSFEAGDLRRSSWVQSRVFAGQTVYYPFKYKVVTNTTVSEHYVYLRLAEQYLLRAEARAQQNDLAGAQADINMIRNRAGLPNITATDQLGLLLAIEQERRIELFAEWGHRWFDLKRSNRADAVLGALKPLTWQSTDALWPIPQNQLNLNPRLTQNPGY